MRGGKEGRGERKGGVRRCGNEEVWVRREVEGNIQQL